MFRIYLSLSMDLKLCSGFTLVNGFETMLRIYLSSTPSTDEFFLGSIFFQRAFWRGAFFSGSILKESIFWGAFGGEHLELHRKIGFSGIRNHLLDFKGKNINDFLIYYQISKTWNPGFGFLINHYSTIADTIRILKYFWLISSRA